MTAIIDGVTVIGTPEEINRLINMRAKTEDQYNVYETKIPKSLPQTSKYVSTINPSVRI